MAPTSSSSLDLLIQSLVRSPSGAIQPIKRRVAV